MASKQLVNDAVLTMPAKFLSYQQTICPLPKLDIHSPDEATNFNLKDNTDHTRIFAKITLSYGKGPRSAPLDLLLFDSQCWECTSEGDCTARTKDHGGSQCFFAAGTSSIQDFRIGRTISTRVSPGTLVSKIYAKLSLLSVSPLIGHKLFRVVYYT